MKILENLGNSLDHCTSLYNWQPNIVQIVDRTHCPRLKKDAASRATSKNLSQMDWRRYSNQRQMDGRSELQIYIRDRRTVWAAVIHQRQTDSRSCSGQTDGRSWGGYRQTNGWSCRYISEIDGRSELQIYIRDWQTDGRSWGGYRLI